MVDGGWHGYLCGICGESNETFVDLTGGSKQIVVEDCSVCCRPNVLTIILADENIHIEVEAEG
jgi:hypothetical protein